ncbi:hypothetical protein NC653_039212 [Populus alba x Populus x berolinensis]|uniref:Uncharacterized protein n=1 Tax=Populus alba x Populus x berolinensis TaxID=444605 RepID=A0AAD6LAP8_9ROSI|nr:hypothetical protein NC653_039212 [Populus alba x Populus x berolinensis]
MFCPTVKCYQIIYERSRDKKEGGRKKPSWRRQKVGDKRRVPITQQENHLGSTLGKFLSNQNDVS